MGSELVGIGRVVVGVRKAVWSSLPWGRDATGQMKPTDPWRAGQEQGAGWGKRGQQGQGDIILPGSLVFSDLNCLLCSSVPLNPVDNFLPFFAPPSLCIWQGSIGTGGCDPVGRGTRMAPQAPSPREPQFTQLQNDRDRLQEPLVHVFSCQDAVLF